MTGASTATTTSSPSMTAPSSVTGLRRAADARAMLCVIIAPASAITDAGVQRRVEHVDHQEQHDVHRGRVQDEALNRGIIGVRHGVERELSKPRPREDRFDEHNPAEL